MYKIQFVMDSGKEHTLSRQVYGGSGPLDEIKASSQLSLATEKLRYFTVDDGAIIFAEHISEARIVND